METKKPQKTSVGINSVDVNTLNLVSNFIYQTDAKVNCLKYNFTLKLILKQLLHVSVQSPSSGSALFDLAKVTVV
jgi:hypothetical protein